MESSGRLLEAARRTRVQIPMAESLEKMGKTAGALTIIAISLAWRPAPRRDNIWSTLVKRPTPFFPHDPFSFFRNTLHAKALSRQYLQGSQTKRQRGPGAWNGDQSEVPYVRSGRFTASGRSAICLTPS